MDKGEKLSVALNFVETKIAFLNMELIENNNSNLKNELEEYLKLKKEIYKGNLLIIDEIISNRVK